MSFRVGQKVVAVGYDIHYDPNSIMWRHPKAAYPEIGGVYTIRQINVWAKYTLVLLHEVDNQHMLAIVGGKIEPGWDSRAFRPVIEHKTDISVFHRILDNVNIRAPMVPAD